MQLKTLNETFGLRLADLDAAMLDVVERQVGCVMCLGVTEFAPIVRQNCFCRQAVLLIEGLHVIVQHWAAASGACWCGGNQGLQ